MDVQIDILSTELVNIQTRCCIFIPRFRPAKLIYGRSFEPDGNAPAKKVEEHGNIFAVPAEQLFNLAIW